MSKLKRGWFLVKVTVHVAVLCLLALLFTTWRRD